MGPYIVILNEAKRSEGSHGMIVAALEDEAFYKIP
jgi:hypothetical protein